MNTNTLGRSEKLKSRKSIESLFRNGHVFFSPPFKLIFRKVDLLPGPAVMTVAVPKRLIKRAVDRNLIKRRTREAYRNQKSEIYSEISKRNEHFEILFLYQSSEILDYNAISNSIKFLMIRLAKYINR